jgi:hypothetical protein
VAEWTKYSNDRTVNCSRWQKPDFEDLAGLDTSSNLEASNLAIDMVETLNWVETAALISQQQVDSEIRLAEPSDDVMVEEIDFVSNDFRGRITPVKSEEARTRENIGFGEFDVRTEYEFSSSIDDDLENFLDYVLSFVPDQAYPEINHQQATKLLCNSSQVKIEGLESLETDQVYSGEIAAEFFNSLMTLEGENYRVGNQVEKRFTKDDFSRTENEKRFSLNLTISYFEDEDIQDEYQLRIETPYGNDIQGVERTIDESQRLVSSKEKELSSSYDQRSL